MPWTQEEEEAYIFEQNIKDKSVKQLEKEIIDRISILNSNELKDILWKIYNITQNRAEQAMIEDNTLGIGELDRKE